ncbi:hypothetical protein QQA43_30855 (plasmid) [Mycolicibacterium vanbaalenii]|nr:hypothetical protein [Mycolicibacterium vanbaalenii]WND60049.1 hypothetical protein QQA43_30855 [Mycolicibacterium vanbaalenii]
MTRDLACGDWHVHQEPPATPERSGGPCAGLVVTTKRARWLRPAA